MDEYKTTRPDGEVRVNYSAFCQDIEAVFTKPFLEKTPLETVPAGPEEIYEHLSPDRFTRMVRGRRHQEKREREEARARAPYLGARAPSLGAREPNIGGRAHELGPRGTKLGAGDGTGG